MLILQKSSITITVTNAKANGYFGGAVNHATRVFPHLFSTKSKTDIGILAFVLK